MKTVIAVFGKDTETCERNPMNKRVILKLSCIVLAVVLAMGTVGCGKKAEEPLPETTAPTEPAVKELSVTDLLKAVLTLKDDLETAVDEIKEEKLDAARTRVEGIFGKTQTIRESMTATLENLGDSMPSLQEQLRNIQEVLNLVDMASEEILLPVIRQLQEVPFSF